MLKWIQAARLRTLPLSLSGIILGAFLAYSKGFFNNSIFIFTVITTLLFQVLSNFANDYGDGIKGTDNNKLGEQRAIQSGLISVTQMKKAIIILIVLSLISSLVLLYIAFIPNYTNEFYLFLGLGIASIMAAIFYTMGKNPYGYYGLGDLFVLLFFGLLGVMGSEFLYTKTYDVWSILPALSIGFFSVSVLNLNNMRDFDSDLKNGKHTFATYLGKKKALIYQLIIMYLPFALSLIYVLKKFPEQYAPIIFIILMFPAHAIRRNILEVKSAKNYDPYLKQVAILILTFSILLGIGISGIFKF